MINNNISGIIRGHQDNYSNSIIYCHDYNGTNYIAINDLKNRDKCDETQICFNKIIKEDERSYGALARIVISLENYEQSDYKPVITLATCTEIGKNLIADSFGLLRFDISDIKDFSSSLFSQIELP
jgi:hypothetical protein